jgi:hypothetical protein
MSNDSSPNEYNYSRNIKAPISIGINDGGSFPQLGRNIDGLREYVKILINGNSRASATNGPLGNKFFFNTTAKCNAIDTCTTDDKGAKTCQETDRYIYVSNIPLGTSAISGGAGVSNSQSRGLISGSMEDAGKLNPMNIFKAFTEPATPDCQNITMQTIDVNNNSSSETHYVTLTDIKSMDPCLFNTAEYNHINPLTNQKCIESFKNNVAENAAPVMSDDPIDKLYFAGLACVGIYIFYCIMKKSR